MFCNPISHITVCTEMKFFQFSDKSIPIVNEIVYLGVTLNKSLNFDTISREKFKNVQRSIFSLSFLGLKPRAISPFLQKLLKHRPE